MIRNLKVLGLALVAVFALSAMAASAASADDFTAESYPVTLTGTHDPETPADKFTTTGGSVECPNATYHATASGATTALTVTPEFNSPNDTCKAFGLLPTIIDMNGCTFTFNVNAGTTTGTVDIHECTNPATGIAVTVNDNTAGTMTTKCTVHVEEQTGINGVTYKNVGAGATREVTIEINSNNVKYTETAGTGFGACGTGVTHTNGTFVGKAIVTGEVDEASTHVGLFLS